MRGSFGAPGEQLLWRVEGKQLAAVRKELMGTLSASGAVTGSMDMPRTSFEVDARGLGWTAAARSAGCLAPACCTPRAAPGWRRPARTASALEADAKGIARAFNPAAFGDLLPGSVNASFDASGHAGADWRAALNLTIEPSTLANAPLWGYARLTADAARVSNADIDLHVGPNILAAKGSFGSASDTLDWRVDAPQLALFGANFGGVLRGSGKLSGSAEAPSLSAALDGQNLKLFGQHQIKAVKGTASVGSGHGAADPLVGDIELTGYTNGSTVVDSARLQSA
ncbi:hypothetical protein LP419_15165 [Massilia sp. H-1]|nr:hypothetical protein LP419_15165 [Massilia sp. H-1]